MTSLVRRTAAVLATMTVLLGGCTTGSAPEDSATPRTGPAGSPSTAAGASYHRYVALGDSFTAAPYVPLTDLANGCLRSNGNYPALVAEALDVDTLVDVSCSAADTRDLVRRQRTFEDATVPPQLDAVTADTDLVTLGIGGNDFGLFATLLETCTTLRDTDPAGAPCTDYLAADDTDLTAQIERIGDRVATALATVQRRAPQADVLLVGYPRIVPETGSCPRLLPLAQGDYRLAERVSKLLQAALRGAARRAGVGFVDMYAASRGHDVCSEDPWVNGRFTDQERALAFHPFPEAMEAVAERIVARLG